MRSSTLITVGASLVASALAQSACSGQQYNTLPGFPASNSGCYPTNYYATSDLGSTNPTDAMTRCSTQCTNAGTQCGSYVAQVNKAADSDNYSGTCFLFSPSNPPTGPRTCANTAYLLIGYMKDSTNACFSSSASAATAYCSSYLGIPVFTVTATSTPAVVTTTTTVTTHPTVTATSTVSATATTTITTTSTSTTTSTVTVGYTAKRRSARSAKLANLAQAVAAPACVTSGTPATRISAACSCLSVKTSTTTSTSTLVAVTNTATATSTVPTTTTVTTTVTSATVTVTNTATTTVSATATATCGASTPNLCNSNTCVNFSNDRRNCGSCGNTCPGGYQCSGGVCSNPAPCNSPNGNIYYCNSGSTCVCYDTVDGRGYCDNVYANGSQCGSYCQSSFDCPNGSACLNSASTGCGFGNCAAAACANPNSRKLLRSVPEEVVSRDVGAKIALPAVKVVANSTSS